MSGKRNSHTLYRIGEAARALNLKTCVLRFWEGEFSQLDPVRTPKGQRLYTERDMSVLRRIRSLLHEQGMTIEGARRVLAGEMAAPAEGARRVLAGEMADPAEGARRVLAGEMAAPAEGARRVPAGEMADPAEGAAEPCPGPGAAARHALLAEAVAELESLRGLLRAAPADSPPRDAASPPSSSESPEADSPSSPPFSSQGPSL